LVVHVTFAELEAIAEVATEEIDGGVISGPEDKDVVKVLFVPTLSLPAASLERAR
jgi:hypothetical protein